MPYDHIIVALLFTIHIPASSATTDTISAGQALSIRDKLVSKNGRYALGFFEASSKSSQNTSSWYLGIWFNNVPKFTQAWVANRDDPIKSPTSLLLKISHDGNLVIVNRSTDSIFWSSQANMTKKSTIAMLLNSGNFILRSISNSSDILWQSFDHPTDTFFPGAKLGWDKITGLNRRLVSNKNSLSPATGVYFEELDPSGVNQFILAPLNSSAPYWSSGVWNGQYFASVAEMLRNTRQAVNRSFVDNAHEKYYTYALVDETTVVYHHLDVSGQIKTSIWLEGSQDWHLIYVQPRAQCDVYAACGPFTICNDDALAHCTCMKGFTIRSPEDWELDDRTGGCLRNTPLDCIENGSVTSSTDKFYSVPCVSLSQSSHKVEAAHSIGECGQVCLDNCSCSAYSFSDGTCSVWHEELLNIRQIQCSSTANSNGETLYLRLAAKDVQSLEKKRRGFVIGVATGTSVAALGLFVFIMLIVIWSNKRKSTGLISNSAQGCNGIIAFRYIDLQRATKNFSEKLGRGGFGSVFKGFLNDSIAIAVKRLDGTHQREKQFRAEVSSIGIIQHINLVKLIGFCCEGARRLLVYEHMPNGSLDIHIFQSQAAVLKWSTRYQIALGVARGLAYLHADCRDCIIHCDIKPENILLSDSFVPKIADFGMAKFLGRDFSRVLTTMRGTIGYLAPEWISGVAITPKVDVYAYGMVLLEIVSGRRNSYVSCSCGSNHDVYYPVHVARQILEGDVRSLLDHRLCSEVNLKEAEIACKVACWCIQDDESDRPTMGEVVQILEGLLEISIPPMPRLLQAIAGSSHSTCF
ncbi:G-type lectin S-receptor-like serine/threonine-protein kinase At2g19130 isoform X1 [Phragmites australis]|uniref:G-type lectin S-receptor-like serine/threonine-protein kinase At2g19130 isoform X1 n=1 Tax=Phragmites australis TaxID=29695 RepID=UPI002D79A92C|nr:G-type lectin S-receptor-like serine/threonine-protein kinase At2g19130 isoform X1 [Phragmites australis]